MEDSWTTACQNLLSAHCTNDTLQISSIPMVGTGLKALCNKRICAIWNAISACFLTLQRCFTDFTDATMFDESFATPSWSWNGMKTSPSIVPRLQYAMSSINRCFPNCLMPRSAKFLTPETAATSWANGEKFGSDSFLNIREHLTKSWSHKTRHLKWRILPTPWRLKIPRAAALSIRWWTIMDIPVA